MEHLPERHTLNKPQGNEGLSRAALGNGHLNTWLLAREDGGCGHESKGVPSHSSVS